MKNWIFLKVFGESVRSVRNLFLQRMLRQIIILVRNVAGISEFMHTEE